MASNEREGVEAMLESASAMGMRSGLVGQGGDYGVRPGSAQRPIIALMFVLAAVFRWK